MLFQLLVLGLVCEQMYQQQKLIEFGVRKQIGLWLKQNAVTPHDTVFLEPLGYIGYYSNLKMYDFPGLSSEEVVSARIKLNTDLWILLIEYLHPDWLVLRKGEVDHFRAEYPILFTKEYELAQVFDSSKEVDALNIQGLAFLKYDDIFSVFKRRNQP